jgi:tetratricopeptide (TPR) repeat protein
MSLLDFDEFYAVAIRSYDVDDFDEALRLVDMALDFEPLNTSGLCLKGKCIAHLNRYEEAIAIFGQIVVIEQNNSRIQ